MMFLETALFKIDRNEIISRIIVLPGQYYDEETNLHYNHFRYYDPTIGRYITSDPVGLKGGLNTYNYVDSNAIRFFDINGLEKNCKDDDDCEEKLRECYRESGRLHSECYRLFIRPSGPGQYMCRLSCELFSGGGVRRFLPHGGRVPKPTPDVYDCREICDSTLPIDKSKEYCSRMHRKRLTKCNNDFMVCKGHEPRW